jgi:hypothetical protein
MPWWPSHVLNVLIQILDQSAYKLLQTSPLEEEQASISASCPLRVIPAFCTDFDRASKTSSFGK